MTNLKYIPVLLSLSLPAFCYEYENPKQLTLASASEASVCIVKGMISDVVEKSMEGVLVKLEAQQNIRCEGGVTFVYLPEAPAVSGPFLFFLTEVTDATGRVLFVPPAGNEIVERQLKVLDQLSRLEIDSLLSSSDPLGREAALQHIALHGSEDCETQVWNSAAAPGSDLQILWIAAAAERCLPAASATDLALQLMESAEGMMGTFPAMKLAAGDPTRARE